MICLSRYLALSALIQLFYSIRISKCCQFQWIQTPWIWKTFFKKTRLYCSAQRTPSIYLVHTVTISEVEETGEEKGAYNKVHIYVHMIMIMTDNLTFLLYGTKQKNKYFIETEFILCIMLTHLIRFMLNWTSFHCIIVFVCAYLRIYVRNCIQKKVFSYVMELQYNKCVLWTLDQLFAVQ